MQGEREVGLFQALSQKKIKQKQNKHKRVSAVTQSNWNTPNKIKGRQLAQKTIYNKKTTGRVSVLAAAPEILCVQRRYVTPDAHIE